MEELSRLIEKAKKSLLFTAPILESDMGRFLAAEGEHIRTIAADALKRQTRHVYWVGSGNSWCNLYSGKYLLDRYTSLASDCYDSYEFIWRQPKQLDQNAMAVFASYSGNTEDTVAAIRYAKSKRARTIAIVNKADCLMGREADEIVEMRSPALYILPLTFAYLFSLEIAKAQGEKVDALIKAIHELPLVLGKVYRESESRAKELAFKHKGDHLFYVLASGPLYALGYKFGLTVFMENMRVHGSFIETSEFRHGPAEMLDRQKPLMFFIVGTDESRTMSERVIAIARENGAEIERFDFADHGSMDPLLAPFVMLIPLQWFAVYSALLRGITDLDQRALMGHGSMAKGAGVTWP